MRTYELYKRINGETYSIFEIYHKQAITSIFCKDLIMLELSILRLIDNDANIEVLEISKKLNTTLSNLSNKFLSLENKGYLLRKKNILDQRRTDFLLTDEGKKMVQKYKDYMRNFTTHLKENFGKLELLNFLNFITKIYNEEFNSDKKISSLKLLNNPSILLEVIDNIQDFFINNDLINPIFNDIEINYSQLHLLSELYLNQVTDKLSHPQLADNLMMSYQTLVSKVKKFISLGLVSKDPNDIHMLIFKNELIHILDNFISTRVINYYQLMQHATDKEKKIVTKVFNELKNFSTINIEKIK